MTDVPHRPIHKLLIANRGEIAARIMRSCADMGIETVAVFSDADADAPFVRLADEAVRIGPPPSADSYLRVDRILEAAKRTGADAIHPGFGFLAENAEFAQAVVDAGLVFVGPSPDVIRSMGSKQRAKQIAKDAGVPVIPGYDGADQDPAVLAAEAKKIGFPVLVKASAGGGGKGMRVVKSEDGLAAAIEGAKREAKSSFGDDTLLIEKYVERPRHVEIQILGDQHGELVHLFERECSIQRRHQKIIEEAPSPAVDPGLRQLMGEAAVKLGRAIGYYNAGTVEMILDPDGAFYFLEVNTRLRWSTRSPRRSPTSTSWSCRSGSRAARSCRSTRRWSATWRAGTRWSAASTPRIPPTNSSRRAAGSSSGTRRSGTGCGSTPASSRGARWGSTTTRCSPR